MTSRRKILVTGMTSQQVSPDAHKKAENFTGLLVEALKIDQTNEVWWLEPSCRWGDKELSQYSHVFVGIAPLLSMGANRAYGALSVIERMWGSGKLTLIYDQPDPGLFTRSLNSVMKNWDSFTKPFFSYRREYDVARDSAINSRLMMQAMRLQTREWPNVIVPGLPWKSRFVSFTVASLPVGAERSVRPICLDSLILSRWESRRPENPVEPLWSWTATKSLVGSRSGQRWLGGLGLTAPVAALPQNHRIPTDEMTRVQLLESRGYLSGPGLWTPQIAQALSQHSPVFSDWTVTSEALGPSWGWLPGSTETLGRAELTELARDQLRAYSGALKQPSSLSSYILRTAKSGLGQQATKREKQSA